MEIPIKMDDLGVPPFSETPNWEYEKMPDTLCRLFNRFSLQSPLMSLPPKAMVCNIYIYIHIYIDLYLGGPTS